ncbi:DUF554 domain-containing protein [Nocardioides sp. CFH 31398]|uniref:DUF554 domain-containing protein n=1 Tax=Nocardioides sp. CFH 31398 TaxID=2919579 RepID=UPI001F05A5B4|nr:DUF554 domain-containing protein [Nocardioides sp. CFH 31398]MCH1868323.1 DUF554 domain-containing protein [Nocardioides sp. CFH 31398]
MAPVFPGVGTLVNVLAVLLGSAVGALAGDRLPERTRTVVTDGLGLVTLLIAASSAVAVTDPALARAVGGSAPMLIVLGAILLGGITGSLLRLEDRLEDLGALLQRVLVRRGPAGGGAPDEARVRFVQGFVVSSLVFCVGPLTILGSVEEGLGGGPEQLLLKSALDLFASIAFAAAFGWGVAASVVSLVVVQGGLTLLGATLGDVVPDAQLAAMTATGGLLLIGVALRLLDLKQVKVADLLPSLLVAPLLVWAVSSF